MASGAFRDYVETIRATADIAQVVGEVVQLRKAGRSLVGLCPFHHEKTPSFHVDGAKGVFYCFGCGVGGDLFKFVMEYHHVDFAEAARSIGDKLGVPRPAPSRGPGREPAEDNRRRRAIAALEEAGKFFAQRLEAPEAAEARGYLARRGLPVERARTFGLGLAPPGWDNLLRHLGARGFAVEELLAAGLVVPREGSSGVYDRFRGRIIFPIHDTAGRVVSFGGRALGDETPKYLNGPETEVYDKSRILFRLREAGPEIRREGRAVVVEGYFDAVVLAAVGVPGVVAVCGTAFGQAHARLLRRYAPKVVFFFDGDAAGRKAARRSLGPALAEGLEIRVAAPPDGQDPDDLAREGGADAVRARLDAALDLPAFLVGEAKRDFDVASLDGRVKALEMVLEQILLLESPLARAEAATRIAEGLGIDDDLVRDELRRAARERRRELGAKVYSATQQKARRFSAVEATLIRFLALRPPEQLTEADRVAGEIPLDQLGESARNVVERWIEGRSDGETLDLRRLAELAAGEAATDILSLAFSNEKEPDVEAAEGALAALRGAQLASEMRTVQEEIDRGAPPEELARLLQRKIALARELQKGAAGAASARRSPPRS